MTNKSTTIFEPVSANFDLGSLKILSLFKPRFSRYVQLAVDKAELIQDRVSGVYGQHEALLNLFANGMPGIRSVVEEVGFSITAELYPTVSTDRSIFPKGEITPPESWWYLIGEANTVRDSVTKSNVWSLINDRWFEISTAIVCFAIRCCKLFKNDGSCGYRFTEMQSQLVLARETGELSLTAIRDWFRAVSGAEPDDFEEIIGSLYLRPLAPAINDPTDAQRKANLRVLAHGNYSVRTSTLLSYLHFIGWKEANGGPDVNASKFTDDDVEEWVTKVPLPIQDVVANASAPVGGSGSLPVALQSGGFMRSWTQSSNLRNGVWKGLFVGNPAIMRTSLTGHSSPHNSPIFHTKRAKPYSAIDRVWGISQQFARYNSNFMAMLDQLIRECDASDDALVKKEVETLRRSRKTLEQKGSIPGWYLELCESGFTLLTKQRAESQSDYAYMLPSAAESLRNGLARSIHDWRGSKEALALSVVTGCDLSYYSESFDFVRNVFSTEMASILEGVVVDEVDQEVFELLQPGDDFYAVARQVQGADPAVAAKVKSGSLFEKLYLAAEPHSEDALKRHNYAHEVKTCEINAVGAPRCFRPRYTVYQFAFDASEMKDTVSTCSTALIGDLSLDFDPTF